MQTEKPKAKHLIDGDEIQEDPIQIDRPTTASLESDDDHGSYNTPDNSADGENYYATGHRRKDLRMEDNSDTDSNAEDLHDRRFPDSEISNPKVSLFDRFTAIVNKFKPKKDEPLVNDEYTTESNQVTESLDKLRKSNERKVLLDTLTTPQKEQLRADAYNWNTYTHVSKPEPIITLAKEDIIVNSIDTSVKVAILKLEHIVNNMGMHIEKSDILVTEWDELKGKLKVYIQSLNNISMPKTLITIASVMTIGLFLYKIGIVGNLPNFLINVASNIPIPNFTPTSLPKPSLEESSTFSKLMEIPLSPITIVTGVGSIVTIWYS